MATPVEVAIPFRVAPDGGIATEDRPDRQIYQHLRSLVATSPEERVMITRYGVGVLDMMFEPGDEAVEAVVTQMISDAVVVWEPNLRGVRVRPRKNAAGDGLAAIEVMYSRANGQSVPLASSNLVNTATVRVGGQVMEAVHG